MSGSLNVHAIRLKPGDEVKSSLENFVKNSVPNGCFVLSCCGSVTKIQLRMAANKRGETNKIQTFNEHYEVLALNGTVSPSGTHLHVCLSDNNGDTKGGHVMADMVVFTTIEILLGEIREQVLTREMDTTTGFPELVIKKSS